MCPLAAIVCCAHLCDSASESCFSKSFCLQAPVGRTGLRRAAHVLAAGGSLARVGADARFRGGHDVPGCGHAQDTGEKFETSVTLWAFTRVEETLEH